MAHRLLRGVPAKFAANHRQRVTSPTAAAAARVRCLTLVAVVVCLYPCLSTSDLRGAPAADPAALLEQVQNVVLDETQVYAIRNAQLTRGRISLYLNRGFIALLAPVNGEITGAVFSGDGEVLVMPPDRSEKRSLAQFTRSPTLEENVDSVYLRFTDQTAKELLKSSRPPDPDDPAQPGPMLVNWAVVAHQLNVQTSTRVLTDMLGDRAHPYFYARVHSENLGEFELARDDRLAESTTIGAIRKVGFRTFRDIWCSFADSQPAPAWEPWNLVAKPLRYRVDARINPDDSLEGRTEIELESLSAQDRVISFELSRWLSVARVQDEHGNPITVLNGQPPASDSSGGRLSDYVQVVLPSAHPAGEHFQLVFKYQGNVITDVGNGVLYVGDRGSWYPNIDTGLPSQYDLTFHYPRKLVLVATGAQAEINTVGDSTESRWLSDGVFRVAGFNLGPYNSVERQVGKARITVFATPSAETDLEKRHDVEPLAAANAPPAGAGINGSTEQLPLVPAAQLDSVADIASQAVQYGVRLFGPFPYPRLAIAQAPGRFGQGWPELVYLSTLSFLPAQERSELGTSRGNIDPLGPAVVAHEVAHQWWGNLVGWQSYHDQWLSEGVASYAAALFLAQGKNGGRQFHDLLDLYRSDLLAKTSHGVTVESGGPIWLGARLSNSLDPDGYSNIVYKKACWVLHMLHALMTDPKTGSDARFFAMLRNFVATYQGQSVSTEQFIQHADKYMTADLDLEQNHKLDWFFDEWVYGTGVPTYTFKPAIRAVAGHYTVEGEISQADVPQSFEMPVPIVAIYAHDKRVVLGRVVVGQNGGQCKFTVPSRPLRVGIDEDALLAVVK